MSDFHVSVTLRFKSERAREFFMGGLSDGFGEEVCDLNYSGMRWEDCRDFKVTVYDHVGIEDGEGVPYGDYENGEVL